MAATNDLIYTKLRARYPTGERDDVASLMRRYRIDQGLVTYEQYRDHVTPSCLAVSGADGLANRCSTPDHASFTFTDLDVRLLMLMETWAPIFLTAHLMAQGDTGGQSSWVYSIHPNKAPRTALYDGTNIAMGLEPNAQLPYVGIGEPHWVRSTSDVDNGAGGRTTTYYTAPYDGTLSPSWVQLGDPVVETGIIAMFNSTSPIQIPGALSLTWVGRVLYAEARTSINGPVVVNPDFRSLAPGTTSFADAAGRTWTLSGDTKIQKAPIPFLDAENTFWTNFVP